MDTLNFLNNYEQNRITEEVLFNQGVSEEEISRLLELGIIKNTKEDAIYVINQGVLQTLIVQSIMQNDTIISRDKLIRSGVADSTIRKMIKDGIIFTVSRGMYSFRGQEVKSLENEEQKEVTMVEEVKPVPVVEVSISKEVISNTCNLSITNDLIKKIEEGDLAAILDIIHKTNGEEFIELSKQLWSWLFTNIFQNNQVKVIEPMKIKETPKEKIEPLVEEKQETVLEDNAILSSNTSETEKESSFVIKPAKKTPKVERKRTGLSLEELWNLYHNNKKNNPVVAKEFLEEIIDISNELGIPFDYRELSFIEECVCSVHVSKAQLKEEKNIRLELNRLFQQSEKNLSTIQRIEELVSKFLDYYQDRGILGDSYRANLELAKGNYKESIHYYRKVLEKQPWNFFANKELSYALFYRKDYSGSAAVSKSMLKYYPDYMPARLRLARYYLDSYSISKVKELSSFEITKTNRGDASLYFKNIIALIQDKLNGLERFADISDGATITCKSNYNKLNELLDSYMEIYAQLLDCSDIEEEFMKEESKLDLYESEVYYATTNGEGPINPAGLEEYISNLEITREDELLLYIAAAKVFFVNKLPKYGDYYLKKVGRTKEKSDVVKEEYNQCVKNKMLYLNK